MSTDTLARTARSAGVPHPVVSILAALALALTPLIPLAAQDDTQGAALSAEQEVLKVVQLTFDAMRTKYTAALRTRFDSSARIVTTTTRNGAPAIRATPIDRFITAIGSAKEELNERIYNPEVRIDDNMATVWTRYTFHRGQTFSHCGVDAIQLARTAGGWKIVHIIDTQRKDRCGTPGSP